MELYAQRASLNNTGPSNVNDSPFPRLKSLCPLHAPQTRTRQSHVSGIQYENIYLDSELTVLLQPLFWEMPCK